MDRQSKRECDQCGMCREVCMVSKAGRASIVSELNDNFQVGAWNCVNCWKCMDVCPLGVDIYSFMMARRTLEDIPELMREGINNIIKTGCAMNLKGIKDIRQMHGLKPMTLIKEENLKILLTSHLKNADCGQGQGASR